ncbi:hypothetical protein [Enterobacter sp. 638]|uniref:Uncharacterized protein n=1 Tax=Enterobacter sp. (strain 638) TaxID=399742 RepID=A0A9J9GF41_ENT38|nr:hypothetical protein [Enterobacter sp. 638]ABP59471.1 hypothetical protein Ent638_0786 [Enterobacter sp. 638]
MSKNKSDENDKGSDDSLFKKSIDSLKPLQDAVLSRFSNPLFFSFAISWALFNWDRLAVLFFSKQNILSRIETVKAMPSNALFYWDIPHATTIWFPLASSCIFVLISPYINNLVDLVLLSPRKMKQSNDELLLQNSYVKKKDTAITQVNFEEAHETERLRLRSEQERLRAEAFTSKSNVSDLKNTLATLNESISTSSATNDTIKRENAELLSRLNELRKEVNEYDLSISSSRQTLSELESEISKKKNSYDERIDALKHEITTLKFNLDESNNHLIGVVNLIQPGTYLTKQDEIDILDPAKRWAHNVNWGREQQIK